MKLFPFVLSILIGAVLSLSYLLDGPSEIDAARATAASVLDAQAAARSADRTESRTAQTNPD